MLRKFFFFPLSFTLAESLHIDWVFEHRDQLRYPLDIDRTSHPHDTQRPAATTCCHACALQLGVYHIVSTSIRGTVPVALDEGPIRDGQVYLPVFLLHM